jgi:hypothetical protein
MVILVALVEVVEKMVLLMALVVLVLQTKDLQVVIQMQEIIEQVVEAVLVQ